MSRPDRTVLLIAYHFPPLKGSSGMQRTLRFAQHLPKFGWRPVVLSIDVNAYDEVADNVGNEVPADLPVYRAFGLNAATQLSLFGRYPKSPAIPDRWATWRFWAVRKALKIIKQENVSAIWSTFPITTAHSIGRDVARKSGLPWIAEFRDPMWQIDWPVEATANKAWLKLEREIVAAADRLVFVAPSAVRLYTERYPQNAAGKSVLIENGYDEETFKRAEESLQPKHVSAEPAAGRPLVLLHSGIIYSSERDPTQFFAAVAALKSAGKLSSNMLKIVLRASGGEGNFQQELTRLGIDDIVELAPSIDYVAALQEMLNVDGLLLLQAANCNAQIPAKLYEYLRAGRPILALTDPQGDTACTLNAMGMGTIARLDSATEIETALLEFVGKMRNGAMFKSSDAVVAGYSRQAQTAKLAQLLSDVCRFSGRN